MIARDDQQRIVRQAAPFQLITELAEYLIGPGDRIEVAILDPRAGVLAVGIGKIGIVRIARPNRDKEGLLAMAVDPVEGGRDQFAVARHNVILGTRDYVVETGVLEKC